MPILPPNSLEFISRNTEQTRRLGMRLGGLLSVGDVVSLRGDLGAGKTTFVQGLASGWGSPDVVTSPTFVLVNVYQRAKMPDHNPIEGSGVFYHFDAYRLMGSENEILAQAIDLDLDTMLATGVLVVEWAERVQTALPSQGLHIHMLWMDEMQRDIIITAQGSRSERILAYLRKAAYGID